MQYHHNDGLTKAGRKFKAKIKAKQNLKSHLWSAAAGFVAVAGAALIIGTVTVFGATVPTAIATTSYLAIAMIPAALLLAGASIQNGFPRLFKAVDKCIEKAPLGCKDSSFYLTSALTLGGVIAGALKGAFLIAALNTNEPPAAPVVQPTPQSTQDKTPPVSVPQVSIDQMFR
jgi:hypothetical protein